MLEVSWINPLGTLLDWAILCQKPVLIQSLSTVEGQGLRLSLQAFCPSKLFQVSSSQGCGEGSLSCSKLGTEGPQSLLCPCWEKRGEGRRETLTGLPQIMALTSGHPKDLGAAWGPVFPTEAPAAAHISHQPIPVH